MECGQRGRVGRKEHLVCSKRALHGASSHHRLYSTFPRMVTSRLCSTTGRFGKGWTLHEVARQKDIQ